MHIFVCRRARLILHHRIDYSVPKGKWFDQFLTLAFNGDLWITCRRNWSRKQWMKSDQHWPEYGHLLAEVKERPVGAVRGKAVNTELLACTDIGRIVRGRRMPNTAHPSRTNSQDLCDEFPASAAF